MSAKSDHGYVQILIKQDKLFEKFNTGAIGNKFNAFVNDEKIVKYVKKNIDDWFKDKASIIKDRIAYKALKQIICRENMYRCFMSMIFSVAIEEWVAEGGDLEKIILSKITYGEFEKHTRTYKVSVQKMIDKVSAEPFVEFNSEKEFVYEPYRYMPESSGNRKIH